MQLLGDCQRSAAAAERIDDKSLGLEHARMIRRAIVPASDSRANRAFLECAADAAEIPGVFVRLKPSVKSWVAESRCRPATGP